MDPGALKAELRGRGLHRADLAPDPLVQLRAWHDVARSAIGDDADAMVLATVDADGRPSARNVLLRGIEAGALLLFTNYDSRKGHAIAFEHRVALVFSWLVIGRQVLVEGRAEPLDPARSEAYWTTRPRASQVSATASPQSKVIPDRSWLERHAAEVEAHNRDRPIPRPPRWGGYRVVPEVVELWQHRDDRLHDRLRYRRGDDGAWVIERLGP